MVIEEACLVAKIFLFFMISQGRLAKFSEDLSVRLGIVGLVFR